MKVTPVSLTNKCDCQENFILFNGMAKIAAGSDSILPMSGIELYDPKSEAMIIGPCMLRTHISSAHPLFSIRMGGEAKLQMTALLSLKVTPVSLTNNCNCPENFVLFIGMAKTAAAGLTIIWLIFVISVCLYTEL